MEVIYIFTATKFIFDDIPSDTFGLMIYDIKNNTGIQDSELGGAWKMVESRIPSSPFPIVFGAEYDEPLKFSITFGSDAQFDRNYLHEISTWLCKPGQYRFLDILQYDMEDVRYKCFMSNLKLITLENLPLAFTAEVECDCGYAYSYPRKITKTVNSSLALNIWNDSAYHGYLYPILRIKPDTATSTIQIINKNDNNRMFQFSSLSMNGSDEIYIDNQRQIITCTNGANLYTKFNMKFLRLLRENNELIVNGKCVITIEYSLLRIVGS